MCDLKTKSTRETYTGYKVAYKHKGVYYSPSMGIIYKTGAVAIPERQNRKTDSLCSDILVRCFRERMVGRTAVFRQLVLAKHKLQDWKYGLKNVGASLVILKMTVRNGLLNGKYCHMKVVAGKEIVSMEEVK